MRSNRVLGLRVANLEYLHSLLAKINGNGFRVPPDLRVDPPYRNPVSRKLGTGIGVHGEMFTLTEDGCHSESRYRSS